MKHVPKIDVNNNNGNAPQPAIRKKQLLNRRGSLHHNQFKGVKKELLEKQASLIIHTMTVNFETFSKGGGHKNNFILIILIMTFLNIF